MNMTTQKNLKHIVLAIGCLFIFNGLFAQKVSVYKIDKLLKRIHNTSDTIYVVNFWATWCKPCVAELPEFEKLNETYKDKKVKVILVSMDFKEDKTKKLIPFLQKHNYTSEVILLDEVNGNTFINKVSKEWTGAIPATLIVSDSKTLNNFYEKKVTYEFLEEHIK